MNYHTIQNPAHAQEILRRHQDFSPENALLAVTPLQPDALRILARANFALPPILASATGPRHQTVRRIVASYFSPKKVAATKPRIQAITTQQCESAAQTLTTTGHVDLTKAISRHVPPHILQDLTGLEITNIPQLNQWSQHSLELFWGWPTPERQTQLAQSAADLYTWIQNTIHTTTHPGLIQELQHAALTTDEICSLTYFLIIAGQETTTQLTNIAYLRALQHPHHWNDLTNPDHSLQHIRHILTTESSVPTWRRITTHNTTLAGKPIPAGTQLLLELTGNHPPNPSPSPNSHNLAFGHGIHRCLGAHLAELEAATILTTTAQTLGPLQLTNHNPPWTKLLSFQTPTTVNVTRPTP